MLGEFEYLLITAAATLGEKAYGVVLREAIVNATGRTSSIGALYTTLDRLEAKGLVKTWMGEGTPPTRGPLEEDDPRNARRHSCSKKLLRHHDPHQQSCALGSPTEGMGRVRNITRKAIEVMALQLTPTEREIVLGDLIEARETAWRGMREVSGLAVRRQLQLWKGWRPWLAAPGLTPPCSFMLIHSDVF